MKLNNTAVLNQRVEDVDDVFDFIVSRAVASIWRLEDWVRDKIKLHLIGHLQSNKVRKAIDLFDVIQTVDSVKLAERINKVCKEKEQQQQL